MPTYPTVIPNYCTAIGIPKFNNKELKFDGGQKQIVQTQFRPSEVPVTLQYSSLTIAQAVALYDFGVLVNGVIVSFNIPDAVFRMPSLMLAAFKRGNPSGLWRFESEFQISPVTADVGNDCSRYSTTIQIRGEMQ